MISCKKENLKGDTEAALKGTWKSSLVTDIAYDTRTKKELSRSSYLNGLGTIVTFDGNGSATSRNDDYNVSLTHSYTVRAENNHRYVNTNLVGFDHVIEYEIIDLFANEMQLKAIVETDKDYNHTDGLNYNVYYERTEYFIKQ